MLQRKGTLCILILNFPTLISAMENQGSTSKQSINPVTKTRKEILDAAPEFLQYRNIQYQVWTRLVIYNNKNQDNPKRISYGDLQREGQGYVDAAKSQLIIQNQDISPKDK